jgi:hypothetical protein
MDEATQELFDALALLRDEKDEADRKYREVQSMLVAYLTDRKQKTAAVRGHKFTLVAAERTVIDEDGLKKGLGAKAWNKFTIKKLDRSKLEAALNDGSVDPVLVARHSVVKKDTPHIRISTVEQE